jgi:hypothetical protein
MRNSSDGRISANRATESSRGMESSRWPLRKILAAGYGVATVYYGDLFPITRRDGLIRSFHATCGPDRATS